MSSASIELSTLSRSRSVASVAHPTGADGRVPVLGEGYRSPDPLCRHKMATLKDLGLNVKNLSKLPKLPRPTRTLAVFESTVRGLRDHVQLAEGEYVKACEESAGKQGPATGASVVANGQHSLKVKSAERQRKRTEYLLSKVEELLEYYTVQNRMREGAVHMSKAYQSTISLSRKASIANLQCGYKECTQTMCAIEAQLESMLGQFNCKMKGVMGFARVMPGDKFEVTMRLGNQKWKSFGRVGKDGTQAWSDDEKSFKVYTCHSFIIKVFECKLLGRVLLGEKRCDALGLFAAIPQSLTVDVNSSGTIKLNLITHWDPLAHFTEHMVFFNPPGRISTRPLSMISAGYKADARGPVGSSLGHSSSADLIDRGVRLRHTTDGRMPPSGAKAAMRPDLLPPDESAVASYAEEDEAEEQEDGDGGGERSSGGRRPRPRSSRFCDWPASVEESLALVRASLELHCGRFLDSSAATLGRLQRAADEIEQLVLRAGERPPSRASSVSQAIEHAFDFLNSEECDDDAAIDSRTCGAEHRPGIVDDRFSAAHPASTAAGASSPAVSPADSGPSVPALDTPSSDEGDFSSSVSPHSTARSVAADSGIESYVHTHLSERSLVSASSNYTVAAEARSSTGSAELDAVVKQHVEHCCLLLEELEMSRYLSAKEEQLWQHLEQQAAIVEGLARLLRCAVADPKSIHNLHRVMNDTAPLAKAVYEFWVHHVKEEHPLYMTREQFVLALEKAYAYLVRSKFDVQPSRVFAGVTNRIIDGDKVFPPHFRPKLVVTVHQFLVKMEELEQCSLEDLVLDVATELYQLESLKCGNETVAVRCIQSLQDTIPSDDVLGALLSLLTSASAAVSAAIVSYFKNVERSQSSRDIVVSMVAAGLTDPRADVRAGACVALEKLKAHEAYDRLVETSRTDVSKRIQAMARQVASTLANNEQPTAQL